MSFWQTLSLPIIGLAPMDGVTDQPFRWIQKKYGRPAVVFTEFTSAEGVCHGAVRLLRDFLFDESQRPIVAQIYGTTPEFFRQTAIVLMELGFDGIDINMGCPAKNVAHSGAGAALIKTPELAQEIVRATKRGVSDYLNGQRSRDCPDITEQVWQEVERRHQQLPEAYRYELQPVDQAQVPVSVKTRVGYDQVVVEDWMQTLLEVEPAVISVHGRTLKQQYGGMADWEAIGRGGEIVQQTSTFYLGNGDVLTSQQAVEKSKQYPINGVLIGRGSFGNPWCFTDQEVTSAHRLAVAVEHARLFEQTFKADERYNFLPMRKHLGWYAKGFRDSKQLRIKLLQCQSAAEVEQVVGEFGGGVRNTVSM